ncbi:MAG TPA: oligosaccharide flippase family protein [Mycobacteriales bacterium]|nr:oligosaccharide flippase family protein [Mycobacteriales bacterium]
MGHDGFGSDGTVAPRPRDAELAGDALTDPVLETLPDIPPGTPESTLTTGASHGTLPRFYRRAAVTGYLMTFASIVVALVATPILARTLGPERFGIWAVVGASVTYLEVLELGFGSATVSFIADAAAHRDPGRIRRVIATSFWTLAVPGVAAMLLAGVAAIVGPDVLHLHGGDATAMRVLTLLLGLDLALSIPSDTFGGALVGLGRMDLVNLSLLAVLTLQTVGWIIVLASGGRLVVLGLVTAGLGLLGQASRYVIVGRLVPGGVSLRPQGVQRDLLRPMGALSGWFALSDLNKIVVQRLDILLVGVVVDVKAAALYAVAQKLALVSWRAVDPATLVLFPHAADLRARGDLEGLGRLLDAGTRLSVAITGPVAVCAGFFAQPLLKLWVGSGYEHGASVVTLLTASMVVVSLSTTTQHVLKGMRAARPAGLGSLLDAVVNLGLSIGLGLAFGTWGIAAATLAGGAAALILVMLPAACKALGESYGGFVWRLLKGNLPPAIVASGFGLAFRLVDPHPGYRALVEVAAVGFVYVALLTRTALDEGERERIAARIGILGRTLGKPSGTAG